MKRLLSLLSMVSIAVSCVYDDTDIKSTIEDHERRISDLEQRCTMLNSTVDALSTTIKAIEDNDWITSVVPVTSSGEQVGYTLNFSKNGPVTIYNGRNGGNPVMGVVQYEGVYYWTVDGVMLCDEYGSWVRASGYDGVTPEFDIYDGYWFMTTNGGYTWWNLGKAVGQDGKTPVFEIYDGKWYVSYDNGATWQVLGKATGSDGITPQLEISDGSWFISYDNGATWKVLGKATGKDGDSMFQSVTYDEKNVILTLADGNVLTVSRTSPFVINSISVVPKYSDGSVEILEGSSEISFEIYPLAAAEAYVTKGVSCFTLTATYSQTRSVYDTSVDIPVNSVSMKDGRVVLQVSGRNLSETFFSDAIDANARLLVSYGDYSAGSAWFRIVPHIADKTGGSEDIGYEDWEF